MIYTNRFGKCWKQTMICHNSLLIAFMQYMGLPISLLTTVRIFLLFRINIIKWKNVNYYI